MKQTVVQRLAISLARGLVLGLVACIGASAAHADGFRNPPGSASGLGEIGARYTLIKEPSAMGYNPANLSGLTEDEAQLALTFVKSDKEYTSPAGDHAAVNNDWITLPNAYLAWPIDNQGTVAGIAITTPYGQSTEYEKNSVFHYTAPYFAQLRAVNVNPTVSFRLNDSLSLALGLDILWSDLKFKQFYPWGLVTGNPATPDGVQKYDADGVGFGGNAGLLWKTTDKQEVGLTYRSAIKIDYEGDFEVSNIPGGLPPPLQAVVTRRSDFNTSIKFPHNVGAGYGIHLSDKFAVGVDVEWFKWSDYEKLDLDIDNNSVLLPSSSIPQDWEDTWTYGIGAEYALNDAWKARAGYIYLETPVPEKTQLPSLAENDQQVFTVGLGYHKDGQRLDFAYAYGRYDDRTVNNSFNPAYNGKYEFESHIVGVSYAKAF